MTHQRGVREPWLDVVTRFPSLSSYVARASEINYKVTTRLLGVLLALGKETTSSLRKRPE